MFESSMYSTCSGPFLTVQILWDSMSFPIPAGREPFASTWRGPELADIPHKVVRRGSSSALRTGSEANDSDNAWDRMPVAKIGNRGYYWGTYAIREFPHSPRDPPPL